MGVFLPEYPAVPPPDFNPLTIAVDLVSAVHQGINDFFGDISRLG